MKIKDLLADLSGMDPEAEVVIWSGSATEALREEPRTYRSQISFRPIVVRKDGRPFLEEVDTDLEGYGGDSPQPDRMEVLEVVGDY